MNKKHASLSAGLALFVSSQHAAQGFQLTPNTCPETIVRRQLNAFQQDDIFGVYKYSSPSQQAVIRSWQQLSEKVRSPPYHFLVNHERAEPVMMTRGTGMGGDEENSWRVLVRVKPNPYLPKYDSDLSNQEFVEYWWLLSRSGDTCDEPFPNCYKVDGVLPANFN